MASLNKVHLIGNVGKIDTRYLPDGKAVTNISLAINESWKDKDGNKQERVEWVRISMFGKLAEIAAQYVNSGSSLYISGKMQTRKWTDKDGIERYTTEIIADTMQMLGSRQGMSGSEPTDGNAPAPRQSADNSSSAGAPRPAASRPAPDFSDMEDDIPW